MTNPFGSVPVPKQGRTLFDESHEVAGTFPLSSLCPVFLTETIPGDTWDIDVFNLTKLETLIAPAFQRMDASLLWFKLPKRLVFRHFKKWYSGGENGDDSHEKPHIYISELQRYLVNLLKSKTDAQKQEYTELLFGPGSLWSYLGLPVPLFYDSTSGVWKVRRIDQWTVAAAGSDSDYIDIMPILAYNMIYDQYFRDQTLSIPAFEDADEGILRVQQNFNLVLVTPSLDTLNLPSVSGLDLSEGGEVPYQDFLRLLRLFNRAWRKDYFTSALPTPQRGPEVTLNMFEGQTAQVTGDGPLTVRQTNGAQGEISVGNLLQAAQNSSGEEPFNVGIENEDSEVENISVVGGLKADLSGLSPITITAFRNLFKLQAFLEKNNVGGGRYIETILAQWAERVPDFTVQRAQHVRSTSIPVQITEVTATANSDGINSQVGDQAGRARSQGNLGRVHIYTQEPSFIIGLYCVTAPGSYAGQGIPKMYQRITRFDEPWRDFQHIGEQAIKTRELYFDFTTPYNNDEDFGYQQRFSEYKYMPDRVVGDFQTSLAYWHMARMFAAKPALNGSFIKQVLDERIFAVQNARPVTADFYFKATAKRKLSKFSTPKLS